MVSMRSLCKPQTRTCNRLPSLIRVVRFASSRRFAWTSTSPRTITSKTSGTINSSDHKSTFLTVPIRRFQAFQTLAARIQIVSQLHRMALDSRAKSRQRSSLWIDRRKFPLFFPQRQQFENQVGFAGNRWIRHFDGKRRDRSFASQLASQAVL